MISPPICRGLTTLKRELFHKSLEVVGIRVPVNSIANFLKVLNNDLLNQPKLRNVIEDPTSKSTKIILLKTEVESLDLDNLSHENKEFVKKEAVGVVKHTLELNYDYWSVDEILKAILPEGDEMPSSFTQVGHIAHMNLRDEWLPWKRIIGQVILDKISTIKTVVNKVDIIDSTFRNFRMEIMAGEDNMIAEVKEGNCRFRLDFSKVYWNSRLHTEHDRLVKMFKKDEYVCDIFAGVGPFAIAAAKKGCIVYANDLNPASYKYLQENAVLNKVQGKLKAYNLDGRHFVEMAVHDLYAALNSQSNTTNSSSLAEGQTVFKTFKHFVMNLPATAIEFLDAFKGLYKDKEALITKPDDQLPMIHCHCFSKSEEPEKDIVKRVVTALGYPLQPGYKIHFVRKVAPNKDMFCISFKLDTDVAFGSAKRKIDGSDVAVQNDEYDDNKVEGIAKKVKMDIE
ncbi:5244_t:CDS:10 [Paraglomus brasilianum]|uniref:tRNA (guanine(37)-N1)-methyltransferase n=1 Tax=Paraglomus brasilianum TaxID=144538 RepID=A0A9N9G2R6_9GLOM|nr:5244_t:CDS:10 [Paraglomus brasilianum]